jgi:hypothetical protein
MRNNVEFGSGKHGTDDAQFDATWPTSAPLWREGEGNGKDGAGDGDRTRDIELGKLAFYR